MTKEIRDFKEDGMDRMLEYVDGGVCASIEEIVTALDMDYDALDQDDFELIDDYLFTCEECDWTMPFDDKMEGTEVCLDCYMEQAEDC